MNKFITNYTALREIKTSSTSNWVITEIDTPYGKGHRITSTFGNEEWQWITVFLKTFLNSGVLRFIARSSINIGLGIYVDNSYNKISEVGITTDWSVIESEVSKKPIRIGSYYGVNEGTWFEICDAIVFSDRDSLNQLDAINVPLFKADTMPISIDQGA